MLFMNGWLRNAGGNCSYSATNSVTEKQVIEANAGLNYRTRMVAQLTPQQLGKLFDDLM